MKFSTNTPTVSPNTLHNVGITPTQASRDLNAYGGRGGGEQFGALADAAKMGLALQQKVADGKALEANAEYNRLMSEGTSALMQKKEGEALTLADEYDKLQKSVLAQVNKKYGGYLYGDARESFDAYTMRDDATRRAGVVKYQTAQTDAYRETQYNNQLAECRNAAIEGGGNIEAVGGALNRMDAVVESRFGAYGGEKLIEQKRIAAGQIVGDAVNMAINSGDYAKAESLLSSYKGMLPTNAYIDAKTKLHKQQEIRREYTAIDDIAAQCRDANGKIDLNRGRAMLEALYGRDATKPGTGGNLQIPEVAGYEIGDGVSNATLNDLTEQKLRLLDRDYYARYGQHLYITSMTRDGDGSSWHDSGQAIDTADDNLETSKEARDWLIAQGEKYGLYALDEYEHPSEHATGGHIHFSDHGEALEGGGQAVSAYDPEKLEKLTRMLEAKARSEDAQQRQAESAYKESVMQQMQNAGSYEEAYDILANSGLPMDAQNTLDNAARRFYQVGRSGGASRGGVDEDAPQWNGKAYNPAKHYKLSQTMSIKFQNGQNPTAKEWVEMEEAADALVGSGILSEEQVAELSDVYSAGMSMVTDELERGHTVAEVYNELLDAGASPLIAMIAIAKVQRQYKTIGKAMPYEPDETEENGGSGGAY